MPFPGPEPAARCRRGRNRRGLGAWLVAGRAARVRTTLPDGWMPFARSDSGDAKVPGDPVGGTARHFSCGGCSVLVVGGRGFGFRSADAVTALVMLCPVGNRPTLPRHQLA